VSQLPGAYRIEGELDFEAALADPTLGELFGDTSPGGLMGAAGLSTPTIDMSLTVDQQTRYVTAMSMDMEMQMTEGRQTGSMNLRMSFSFTDFNSPGIDIHAPA
jgi:hypothetical protein